MLLGKYVNRVNRLGRTARAVLAEELDIDLPSRGGIVKHLNKAGCCSADVVVALLRHERLGDATMVAGTPVMRCDPHVPQYPPLPVQELRLGDDVRIVRVTKPCPVRSGNADAVRRYALLRRHMTVRVALARGVRRRDLRLWVQKGWVVVEDER